MNFHVYAEVHRAFATAPDRNERIRANPITGGRWLVGDDPLEPQIEIAVAAILCRKWVRKSAPHLGVNLPLTYEAREDMKMGGELHILAWFARSLAKRNYDYRYHPSFGVFAQAVMANEDAPRFIRDDPKLIRRYPPIAGHLEPGLSWRAMRRTREELIAARLKHALAKKRQRDPEWKNRSRMPVAPEIGNETRMLAKRVRLMAGRRDLIYHGTRYPEKIMTEMYLRPRKSESMSVHFTRSPEVAAKWALMERDDGEGAGAILLIDRKTLQLRYRLVPAHDDIYDTDTQRIDEMEEIIPCRGVSDLQRYLRGVVWE